MLRFYIYAYFIHVCSSYYYTNIELDTLSPYQNNEHQDKLRTYRYVRDCQKVIHGNRTHTSVKTRHPLQSYELYNIKYPSTTKSTYGHWTIVNDPLSMISVLEPSTIDGCRTKTTAYVADSAKQMNCRIAVNAGFFKPNPGPEYGTCLGNIISNKRLVQSNNGVQNAIFGIRQDGTVVIGYLSQDEIQDTQNPFVQLINGVGWILRNGKLNLDESLKAECRELQTTGSLDDFFKVSSARTIIGVDKLGRVHLVQFDGKTYSAGVNLYEAANYLKTLNITDAINFDGGGSATFVVDSTLVNYPTNGCTDSYGVKVLCPKNVSTIICVHDSSTTKINQKEATNTQDSIETLSNDSNRNYGVVILLTVIIGILMLSNVFLCNAYLLNRARVKYLSSGSPKKEALRTLLEDGDSTEMESDEDEL